MHPKLAAPYKTLLVAQRTSLLEQRANLRGGAVGRAEASAEHFGQKEDSSAQLNTERELEFALDARESAELNQVQGTIALFLGALLGLLRVIQRWLMFFGQKNVSFLLLVYSL